MIFFPILWYFSLKKIIIEYNVKIVVVSGVLFPVASLFIRQLKKKLNIKIILDFQGAVEELVEFPTKNRFISNIIYFVLKKTESFFLANIVDGVEIVSDNCKKYLTTEYAFQGKTVKIPCGINKPYVITERNKYREKWIKKLKLPRNKVTFVYSGSTHPWQNLDKVIQFAKDNKDVIVYIFTDKKKSCSTHIECTDKFICDLS